MYITKLVLKDVGPFKGINIEFNSRVLVFIGKNGVGKSTILQSISALWALTYSVNQNIIPKTRYGAQDSSIIGKLNIDNNEHEIRFDYTWALDSENIKRHNLQNSRQLDVPLIAISPYRKFARTNISGPVKESENYNKSEIMYTFANKIIEDNQSSIQNWLVNRYFFSKERWGERYKKELLFFSKKFNDFFPSNESIRFSSVNQIMEPLFTTPTGDIPFHLLSSGIQSIGYMIFEIIQSLNKYYKDTDNIFLEKGVVLIDEIEVHLHPQWQKNILQGLSNMFPNCQFITTTHSPLVVSNCEAGQVALLNREDDEIKIERPLNTNGWLAEDIYNEYMGLETSRSDKMVNLLNKYRDLANKKIKNEINSNELSKYKKLKNKISKSLPESDPAATIAFIDTLTKEMEINND